MRHDHGHGGHGQGGHQHGPAPGDVSAAANRKRLLSAVIIAGLYMGAEIAGGLISNSLALLADAGHMLSDVAALGLSLFAVWIAARPANAKRTWGYYRAEILAALGNGVALVVVSLWIFYEAYRRLGQPPEVTGWLMMTIACLGLVGNGLMLWVLHGGRGENLNLKAAWLHVLADAAGSVGAIVAAALIWGFNWRLADPIASVVIGLLVVASAWRVLKETVSILMESTPQDLDLDALRQALSALDGVADVHDLHAWTITSGMHALSVHLRAADGQPHGDLLTAARVMLHERFGIDHPTIQVEPPGYDEPAGHE